MVSHLAPAGRRTPGTTPPERFAKNPPVRVVCLLLLAGWLTGPSPAAAQSPTIIAGPTNQVVVMGGTVTLGVTAGGPAPAYQWFKDSRLILGATNSTLKVTNAGAANSGIYYVVVTNRNGMVISLPASVTVGNPCLLAWGSNGSGQLGNGTTNDAHTPISVVSNVVAGAAGGSHSLFVTTDGTLWAMGYNYYGQLGNGTTSSTNRPVSVASNVVAVAAGANHSLFVKTDGTLWAMGYNYYGELGNGTRTDAHTPISVASNVVAVAAGTYHSLFVKTNGTLWAMGRNSYGQLGNGTTTDAHTPISVASNVVAVAAGYYHSLFVKTDGTLRAMGYNYYGQLGNGTRTDAHTPISVASNVVTVAAGGFHSLFVMNDGTLRAMGRDSEGQIGLGSGKGAYYAMPLSVASNVVAVAAGYYHSLFVKTNGTLWAMGNNSSGQLGNGTTTVAYKPISVPNLAVANIFPADQASHSLALVINPNATVILGNLNQTYTGSAISVTVSTTPPGLTVNLTYNGSPFAPTNAGSYTVIGTVSDPYYAGGTTNTLVINPATATVTLSNLNQTYRGSAISVLVNTTPPGLSVNLTYNGSPFAPTNVGSYTVNGSVSTPNYTGSATSTLFITLLNAVSVCSAADLRAAVSNGGNIIFACDGTLSLSNEITVTVDATLDASGRAVVLSGMGSNRLFRINAGKTLTLINLTLRDGLAAGTSGVLTSAGGDGAGGAILNQGGTLNAINCSFLSNTAQGGQGNTQINQNVPGAGNAFGGAVVNQGGWVGLTNSVFGNNIAAGGQGGEGGQGEGGMGGSSFGGAVYSDGGVVVADNCIFQTNSSASGGGGDGYFWGLAGDGSGGAIFNTNSALKLIRTVLSNNTCTGGWGGGRANGGAVYHDTGTFEAVDSLFQMNSANGGGGTDWYSRKASRQRERRCVVDFCCEQ